MKILFTFSNLKRIFIAVCLTITSITSSAEKLDIETLEEIKVFAEKFCGKYRIGGKSKNSSIGGSAKVELDNFLKKLANVGIEAAASIDSETHIGVLRKDLSNELKDIRDCKELIWRDLQTTVIKQISEHDSIQTISALPRSQLHLHSSSALTKTVIENLLSAVNNTQSASPWIENWPAIGYLSIKLMEDDMPSWRSLSKTWTQDQSPFFVFVDHALSKDLEGIVPLGLGWGAVGSLDDLHDEYSEGMLLAANMDDTKFYYSEVSSKDIPYIDYNFRLHFLRLGIYFSLLLDGIRNDRPKESINHFFAETSETIQDLKNLRNVIDSPDFWKGVDQIDARLLRIEKRLDN